MENPQSSFEFRPYKEEEADSFQSLMNYVFAGDPSENEPPPPLLPAWSQCAFDGSQLVSSSGAYPFVVRVNGKTMPMHGVTAVGSDPAYRRRGLVRQLITDLLHRGKEEGCAGSILLASMGAIYQRFGYGLASTQAHYSFDPRVASFQFDQEIEGRTRRLAIDEALPVAKHVFKAYAKDKNMMALRADVTWNILLGTEGKQKPFFVAHYNASDEPDAYCVYATKDIERDEAGPSQELEIRDFYYSSVTGYRAIWQFLCAHDLVARIVWGNVAEDDPATGILLEPRCLNRSTSDGLWLRVIDAEQMLGARGYDCDGELVLEVHGDDLCEWNNGSYRLQVKEGETSVEATTASSDLVCSTQGLASLLSGHSSATWLHRNGRLQAADVETLVQYDRLFASRYRPDLSFGF
jgi:predicted acetyltransferase